MAQPLTIEPRDNQQHHSSRSAVYEIVTQQILEQLERGVIPWKRPWVGATQPSNLHSKRPYRGINPWLLAAQPYTSPWWVTYNQAIDLGGHVRRGEKATPVVFWKILRRGGVADVDDSEAPSAQETTTTRRIPLIRFYNVFNVEQCEGLEDKLPDAAKRPDSFSPLAACEAIVAGMPLCPLIRTGNRGACYIPATDVVEMPPTRSFHTNEGYYAALFHELTHATAHYTRLDRAALQLSYPEEELVAELGAAILCNLTSIDHATLGNASAYIGSWLRHLRNDPAMVVFAAARSQRAADFIFGFQPNR